MKTSRTFVSVMALALALAMTGCPDDGQTSGDTVADSVEAADSHQEADTTEPADTAEPADTTEPEDTSEPADTAQPTCQEAPTCACFMAACAPSFPIDPTTACAVLEEDGGCLDLILADFAANGCQTACGDATEPMWLTVCNAPSCSEIAPVVENYLGPTPCNTCGCVPDCADAACGDDGCGGSCGDCDGGTVCEGGQCVAPTTVPPITCDEAHGSVGCCSGDTEHYFDGGLQTSACGDVGCGWTGSAYRCGGEGVDSSGAHSIACGGDNPVPEQCECPTCEDGWGCNEDTLTCGPPGALIPRNCEESHGLAGCCGADGDVYWYQNGQLQRVDCAHQSCGWNSVDGYYDCNGQGADPDGTHPLACGGANPTVGECQCEPYCPDEYDCGDDGCGGVCGHCQPGYTCSEDKQCIPAAGVVPTNCEEAHGFAGCCGPDGFVYWFEDGTLKTHQCGSTELGNCGWTGSYYDCGPDFPFGPDPSGEYPLFCGGSNPNVGECSCEPSCDGKSCGDDGCGGVCGWCGDGARCAGSGACACLPGYAGDPVAGCASVAEAEISINAGAATTDSTTVTLYIQEPGSLLVNGGAETGDLSGWDESPEDFGAFAGGVLGDNHFRTGYWPGARTQLVDLVAAGLSGAALDAGVPLTVRAWYAGFGAGLNSQDEFWLTVNLLDAAGDVVDSFSVGPVTTPGDWTLAEHTFTSYPSGGRSLRFSFGGRGYENWEGFYGPRMDGASVVAGALEMRLSNDGIIFSTWTAFDPNPTWLLTDYPGVKTVYVQFRVANPPAKIAETVLGEAMDTIELVAP